MQVNYVWSDEYPTKTRHRSSVYGLGRGEPSSSPFSPDDVPAMASPTIAPSFEPAARSLFRMKYPEREVDCDEGAELEEDAVAE